MVASSTGPARAQDRRFRIGAFGLALLLGGLNVGLASEDGASLTIYNQNFAVVREPVRLDLQPGENTITFSELTAHLEPPSVILRDPAGETGIRILEQNYRNDPVSQDLLLQVFEGREIDFLRTVDGEETTVRGRIVRAPYVMHTEAMRRYGQQYAMTQRIRGGATGGSNAPIIEVDGALRFSLPGLPLFPELGDDSIMKPTLHWTLDADGPLDRPLELSYISGGFTWEADYNWVAPEEGDTGALLGWVTMDNQSGRTFPEARIKLLAGEVSRIQPQPGEDIIMRGSFSGRTRAPPAIEQREFDEYHLYTLARRTTLRDRETKQVEFVRASDVRGRRLFIYNGSGLRPNFWRAWNPNNIRDNQSFGVQSNKKVWIYREIENTRENGLGIPLPAGRVRFYREDIDKALEFVGENEIEHTPRNETLRIYTGDAFDLVGERSRTDYQRDTRNNTITESFEIKVRNRKEDESVTIAVVEPLYRWYTWEITEHSAPYNRLDSQTIEFPTPVDPNEEIVITYTVKYTW